MKRSVKGPSQSVKSHEEQGSYDRAADGSDYRDPAVCPVGILLALVGSQYLICETGSSISCSVHCIACQAAEGSTACYDDAVNKDPACAACACLTGNGGQSEDQYEGCYEFRSKVQNSVSDGRACAEAAADGGIVIGSYSV